jgi:hypothetical protein
MLAKTLLRVSGYFLCLFLLGVGLGGCTKTFSTKVESAQKVSENNGNFNQSLNSGDQFAAALANLGDLDLDGSPELAVGSPYDDENGTDRGAIWILFMDKTAQVLSKMKLSDGLNGFTGPLNDNDHFGSAAATLGDLDGDGIPELAVGAPGDDTGGDNRGAIWILLLNRDGSVHAQQKISDTSGGFTADLNDNDQFGGAVANIGDLNGDGVTDIAVGTSGDDDGGTDRGAVYILFLNYDGTVQAQQKISSSTGNFTGELLSADHFGSAIAGVGDLDGDGIADMAVGASGDDDGGTDRGAIWMLFMNRDDTVRAEQKISQLSGEFDALLADGDQFGNALANVGDLNDDGRDELAVGASQSDDGGIDRGAIYILFLKSTAEVISSSQISQNGGDFPDTLSDGEHFGSAIAGLGDLDGDGNQDIAVGASLDDAGGSDKGAFWALLMSPVTIGYRVDPNADLATYFSGKYNY